MDGMPDMKPPPATATAAGASPPATSGGGMHHHHSAMMHMTFFWGKNGEILFSGWPGSNSGMYVLVLFFVFFLAFLVEFLSHSVIAAGRRKGSGPVAVGLVQTLIHTLRAGLAYLVMLAVMSFNGGVFLAAVAGHGVGFLVFGSWVFRRPVPPADDKNSDLSPMICA